MEEYVLNARMRTDFGSKAARRLRGQGRLPSIIYGHKEENIAVTLDSREFLRFFEAGHRVALIRINGRNEHGVIKEVQYDPLGSSPVHVDFSRVSRDESIVMEVPIETVGVAAGGGILEFPLKELRVEGPARSVPELLSVNIENLKVGNSIRVHDVAVPEGCRIVDDPELVVVAVVPHRGEKVEVSEEEPTEPEVVSKKKEAEEDDQEEGKK